MNAPIDSNIRHGGELVAVSQQYARPVEQWLDLSTGISPESWRVPELPQSVWQRLPDRDNLEAVAAAYYGCGASLPLAVPGSQWAIEQIPRLLPAGGVAMPSITYAEHPAAWRSAGHQLFLYDDWTGLDALLQQNCCRYLVLVSPGNPGAEKLPEGSLARWRRQLGGEGLCLIDEAFHDVYEQGGTSELNQMEVEASRCELRHTEISLSESKPAELIRLRSVGKFFGLAGLRLGFVLASDARRGQLAGCLSPWSVSHPARYVGALALADRDWQRQQRQRLWQASDKLSMLLQRYLPAFAWHSAGLFVSARLPALRAERLYRSMAERGVLLRLRDDAQTRGGEVYVRIGLPPESGWQRLEGVLEQVCNDV